MPAKSNCGGTIVRAKAKKAVRGSSRPVGTVETSLSWPSGRGLGDWIAVRSFGAWVDSCRAARPGYWRASGTIVAP